MIEKVKPRYQHPENCGCMVCAAAWIGAYRSDYAEDVERGFTPPVIQVSDLNKVQNQADLQNLTNENRELRKKLEQANCTIKEYVIMFRAGVTPLGVDE